MVCSRRSTAEETGGDGDRSLRVVSLAPSATATLRAMGAGGSIVGETVHCDYEIAMRVGGWLNPDYGRIADLDPDLVLTTDALQAGIRDELADRGYDVVHAEPASLDDVLDSFVTLGDAVGRPAAGRALADESRRRLEQVARRLPDDRPVVYCEEWSDPPMAAGNWVPDAVRAAGGRYPFVETGERSKEVSAGRVETAAPEHVFVHVCGRGESVDAATVAGRGWRIPAVDSGNVHVVDDSLLNQPSPKLIDGIETMATVLHPDRFQ